MEEPSSIINNMNVDFYICQSSDYEKVKPLNNLRGFHIIRDPRDLIISGYFSHLHSHAIGKWTELRYHRNNLMKVNKDDGLFLEMEFDKYFIDHIATWNYNDPNILELRYEDISHNPKKYFTLIFEFLGIYGQVIEGKQLWINSYANRVFNRLSLDYRWRQDKMNEPFLDHLIAKNHFQKLSNGRSYGEENPKSHYRSGLAGNWKYHFNEQHKKKFKGLFGDLLVKLNYESNNDW
ncbi:MAG: sulfotransferase domain-containing protein [Bacteroidetes bacterium]|nr:sulfotransferase domain-containing protein [Bacteroidota bacterium]